MGKSAFIRDINSLERLRISLAKFCEENESQIQAIDSKIETKLGILKSNEFRLQNSIERAEDNLQKAKSSLFICESDTYEDDEGNTVYPNCDFEENEIIDCRYELDKAYDNYNTFKNKIRNLEKVIENYQKPKIYYLNTLKLEKEIAISSLKQLINGAENYLSVNSYITENRHSNVDINILDTKSSSILDTLILGIPKLILASFYSFFGISGKLFKISNTNHNGVITTTYNFEGTNYCCSKMKIENKKGTILNIDIPIILQEEKVGKQLIENLENICRTNNCIEIKSWSSLGNINFYKNLNYSARNENKGSEIEVYKSLNNNYQYIQEQAINTFNQSKGYEKINEFKNLDVNPLMIVTPEKFDDIEFWKQHDKKEGSPERYVEFLKHYKNCRLLLEQNKSLDEIHSIDWKAHNAYTFFKNDPVTLIKKGNYYRYDTGGRHRIMAAQYHFLQTGEIIPFNANIIEYKI